MLSLEINTVSIHSFVHSFIQCLIMLTHFSTKFFKINEIIKIKETAATYNENVVLITLIN